MLATNVVADLARNPGGRAASRIERLGSRPIAISVIVACEIEFSLAKAGRARLASNVRQVVDGLEVLPLPASVPQHYAEIRRALERKGTPIGPNDLLITAHARALGLTLVTSNEREFTRVAGLAVENWLAEA